MLGYGSYLLPAVLAVAGWHYFWCRTMDAVYTKVIGAFMVLACTSAFLSLALGSVARNVVHHARASVLVVRGSDSA